MDLHKTNKIFFTVAIVLAVAALIAGFLLLGSPGHQRRMANDNRRLQDLQQIASAVYNVTHPGGGYPASTSTMPLPSSLQDLVKGGGAYYSNSYLHTKDPITGQSYEYRVVDSAHLELCAVFEMDNADELNNQRQGGSYPAPMFKANYDNGYGAPSFWHHPEGRACFTFNTSQYPPSYQVLY